MSETKDQFAFLDNLSETQKTYADEIISKSKKLGIDPRLTLAMAQAESGFNPDAVSPKGAIGLLQVLPSTGKDMNYTEKDLRNPSRNIDAGLQYLNQNLIKFRDPVLAIAGYHAGPNHPYFSDPDKNPLPQDTIAHVTNIKNLGGFTESPKEDTSGGPPPPPPSEPASEEDLRKQKASMLGALGGFGVGAAQTMFGGATPPSQGAVANIPQGATTNANTPGGRYAAKTGYGIGEGTTKEVVDRFKQYAPQPLGEQMMADPKKSSMGAGPRNLKVVPGTTAPLSINRQVPVPPPTPTLAPPTAFQNARQNVKQGLQAVGQGAQGLGNVMGKIPVVPGVVGGYVAGGQGQEAFNRYQKGDMTGATVAGMGALGGLASMVPHPATRALGATASAVSPAALAVLDKMRSMNQQPKVPASEAEMRAAQNPAIMLPSLRRP